MADLPAPPNDDEYDDLVSATEPVYVLDWESDNPGAGAGSMAVYPWRGAYFVVTDSEWEVYPTLPAAIVDGEVNYVTDATVSVDSSEIPAESLAGMLRTFDDGDYRVEINGEPYESVRVDDSPGDAPRPFRRVSA